MRWNRRPGMGAIVLVMLGLGVAWPASAVPPASVAHALALTADGGTQLPPPFGIGLTLYGQSQDYKLEKLSFSLPGFSVNPGSLAIANQLSEANLKVDYWVLPFLNVFGLVGQLDGKTKVDFRRAALPIPLTQVVIDYDGDVYGGGITLAGGGERWFASVTGIYTKTSLSGDFDSKVKALVVSPKVGLHGDRGAVWIGAMYQEAQENHSGNITLPFVGATDFAVELREKDSVNLVVGMAGALTEHWNVELEGGAIGRDSGSINLTYRF